MVGEFRSFLLKTNALALAVGVIIGGALGTVVDSLVNDIIMPPIGLLLGGVDFSQLAINLNSDGSAEVQWGQRVAGMGMSVMQYGQLLVAGGAVTAGPSIRSFSRLM